MFQLDDSTCWAGQFIQPPDGVLIEIKPVKQGMFHLAVSYLRSHAVSKTRDPVDKESVINWINAAIMEEFSPAWNIEDFQWEAVSMDKLIFLRDTH